MPPLAVKGVDLLDPATPRGGTYKVDVLQLCAGPTLNAPKALVATDQAATFKVDVVQIRAATRNARKDPL